MVPQQMRMRVDLGYRGTRFHGWAAQPGLRTVQGQVETALAQILRRPVRVTVAGRTDAGVHARRQTLHLDLEDGEPERLIGRRAERSAATGLVTRLRGVLRSQHADDIVVHSAQPVPADFDARFSAVWRAYSYRLADAQSFQDPLAQDFTAQVKGTLDHEAMAVAACEAVGLHDFLPFCKPRPGATTIRTLHEFAVSRDTDGLIVFALRADAFCHHMVRALVGGLVKVGQGSWPVTRPAQLLAAAESGNTAESELGPMYVMAPQGLVLEEIGYPEPEHWGQRAAQTRAKR